MKIVIVGGGTGGHVYPGIAIADKFKKDDAGNEILFIGTEDGIESKIVNSCGYSIEYVEASGINRKNLLKNVKFFKDYFSASKNAKRILIKFKPDVVIGTGGYVSGAVARVAASMKIPLFIQEQNVFPGMANKSLEKYSTKVFLAYKGAEDHFKQKQKHVISGNPIASKFENLNREECREKIGVKKNSFVILIFGGSLGAGKLNRYGLEIIKEFYGSKKIEIILVTGENYFKDVVNDFENSNEFEKLDQYKNIKILDYIYNMEEYMEAADLVISRSGALTVSELTFLGKPTILIPSPNVTNNHQLFNAEEMMSQSSAMIIEEKNENNLVGEIKMLIENKNIYLELLERGKLLKGINGAEIIIKMIKETINRKKQDENYE